MKALLVILIIIIAIILIVLVWSGYEARQLVFSRYILKTKKESITEPFRIVFISDLHDRKFDRGNKLLIKAIKSRKPDYIVIGGDMISDSNKPHIDNAIDALRGLANVAPIFYAPGNHETKISRRGKALEAYLEYRDELDSLDIAYLSDDKEILDENINIYGIELERDYYVKTKNPKPFTVRNLENKIGKLNPSKFNILISHTPEYFEAYAEEGFDLVLAGHYHGGLMVVPNKGGFISPKLEFYPAYCFGMFKKAVTSMIVTRGIGSHTLNIRINNLPEIVVIDVKKV